MEVKFKSKTYECLDIRPGNSNDGANTLQLLIGNVEDINELKNEATNCSRIEIMDGDVVTQVFDDYVYFISISSANDMCEITVSQPSLVQQVAVLKQMVADQSETIIKQHEHLMALQTTQDDQDDAINYLLMGEEVL